MLEEITDVINDLKRYILSCINVTRPFKIEIIPFLDELEFFAKKTQSVNTIYKKTGKIRCSNSKNY